jgi:hypothetical protein
LRPLENKCTISSALEVKRGETELYKVWSNMPFHGHVYFFPFVSGNERIAQYEDRQRI